MKQKSPYTRSSIIINNGLVLEYTKQQLEQFCIRHGMLAVPNQAQTTRNVVSKFIVKKLKLKSTVYDLINISLLYTGH